VEISEFTPEQVRSYVNNWFTAQFDHNPEAGKQKAARFLQALELKENQGIQELTVTPIFLSFLCSIYHHKESFPSNRYKLCQTGLDILLVRWDQSKGINRDQFYEKLSVTNKIKLLSHIAEENFQKGKYFLRS
jgi:predicted NACHT family NTPase